MTKEMRAEYRIIRHYLDHRGYQIPQASALLHVIFELENKNGANFLSLWDLEKDILKNEE